MTPDKKSLLLNLPISISDRLDRYVFEEKTNRTQFIIEAIEKQLPKAGEVSSNWLVKSERWLASQNEIYIK